MVSMVIFLCDGPIHGDDNRPPGATRRFVLPGLDGARELELCDPCNKDYTSVLAALLTEYARSLDGRGHPITGAAIPSKPPAARARYKCLALNCTEAYGGPQAVQTHYQRAHGLKPGVVVMPPSLDHCPLCETEVQNPAGIGHHVSRFHRDEHGARSAYEAIVLAAESYGDQFGVAAATVKHLNVNGCDIKLRRHP